MLEGSLVSPVRARGLAVLVWVVAFAVAIGLVATGRVECVPYEVYAAAGQRWRAHAPLYELRTIDGFQYLPQAAILFVPFAWLGAAGAILWRAIGWAAYALGAWRVVRLLAPTRAEWSFLVATCLMIAPAGDSLANGQSNTLFAALLLHVAADLATRRWGRAAAMLAIGLAAKPLMATPLLLACALYRPIAWRAPLALAAFFAAPWLFADHAYVVAQYRDCVRKLMISDRPDRLFEDARGLLATLGWPIPYATFLLVRAGAAVGALAIGARIRRHATEPLASVRIVALAAGYLMLFNPRTQSNSYVIAAAFAALLAAAYLVARRTADAYAMALIVVVGWSVNSHWLRPAEHWLKPLACLAFCAHLVREALAAPPAAPPA